MNLTLGKQSIKPVDHWFGFLFFSLMLGMAWVFFYERTGYLDTASYLIELIKYDSSAIAHGREGAVLSQLIPLALMAFRAPLKAIMIGYSVNFVLLYFACYCFCMYICRHRYAAYAICMLMVFSVKLTFFWPVSELFQSMVYGLVFFAWWNSGHRRSGIVHYPVAMAIGLLCLFTHSVGSAALGFVLIYDLASRPKGDWLKKLLPIVGAMGIVFLFMLLRKNDSYEESHLGPIFKFYKVLPDIFKSEGIQVFWVHLTEKNAIPIWGLILTAVGLTVQRKWTQLAMLMAFHLAYALILVVAFPKGAISIMAENLFIPFAFCQVLVLCQDVIFSRERFYLPQLVIAMVVCAFLFRIHTIKDSFLNKKRHYQTIANNLKGNPDRKLVFLSSNYPNDLNMFAWSGFAESILFSGLQGSDECFAIYIAQEYKLDEIRNYQPAEDLLLQYPWDPFKAQSHFPKDYFNLPDQPYKEVNPYRPIPADSFLHLLDHAEMDWVDPVPSIAAGEEKYVNIRFRNHNPDPIPSHRSLPASVFISYRLIFQDEVVDWRPAPIPLLMDIEYEMEQLVRIKAPEQEEQIEIQFGLVGYDGDTMYLTTPRYPIRIKD